MTFNTCKKDIINNCLKAEGKVCLMITNRAEYLDLVKAFYEQEDNVFIWNKSSIYKFNEVLSGVLIAFLPIRFLDPFKENPLSLLKSTIKITFFISKHEYMLREDYLDGYKLKFFKTKPHFKNLIIFSNQRSGSTMFTEELSSTNLLGHPTELVHSLIVHYNEYSSCNHLLLLESLIQRSVSKNGIFSVKVMMNQFTQFRKLYPSIYKYFTARLDDCYFIFFIRNKNILQALSYHHAIESDIWHKYFKKDELTRSIAPITNEAMLLNSNIKYDHSKVRNYVKYFRGYNIYLKVLSKNIESKTIIFYEDYIKEKTFYIMQILNIFGFSSDQISVHCSVRKSFKIKKLLWRILYYYNESKSLFKFKFCK